jgi:site-specific recombinase XerD
VASRTQDYKASPSRFLPAGPATTHSAIAHASELLCDGLAPDADMDLAVVAERPDAPRVSQNSQPVGQRRTYGFHAHIVPDVRKGFRRCSLVSSKRRKYMTKANMTTAVLVSADQKDPFDQAQLAAAAYLARYGGRTLETYRYDVRVFFQWCADVGLTVLEATRPHIELWRADMEQRGLAASTIDRRLSTICGLYRFAHIDGRIAANPAQYVRRPKVYPSEGRGLDRGELGTFLFTAERYDRDHAALAMLLGLNGLRVSEACATNAEDLGFDRGDRTLRIIGKGNKPAVIPLVPRVARTIDLALGERSEGPILHRHDGSRLDPRTAHRWVRSIGKKAGLGDVHPHMLRGAFIMAALDAGVPLRDVQIAARHADPRTTTIYDRRRENFDRHAAYVVVAFVAGG